MQWMFIYICRVQEVMLRTHALHNYRYCECSLVLHVSLHTNQKQCAVKY